MSEKARKAKWRVLKFVVASSSDPKYVGEARYMLLEPYSKKNYLDHKKLCNEAFLDIDLEGLYVDIKTRKLWRVVRDNIKDIDTFAIEKTLKDGTTIEPYNPQTASRMIALKLLQENLVEWWCK